MSSDTFRPIDPVPEEFAGTSLTSNLKRLFHATRPKFFAASVLPVLAGTAWGALYGAQFSAYVFALALLATVCVHGASNVLNDVGDDRIGTDARNTGRIYPYTGGSRFIQTGILSQATMARLGITLIAIAALAGLALLVERGPMVIAFGIAGILFGVLYSLGPVKLASLGLGEITVGIAFGVLPVTGAAWLQGATIDAALILFSIPLGAWVENILLINGRAAAQKAVPHPGALRTAGNGPAVPRRQCRRSHHRGVVDRARQAAAADTARTACPARVGFQGGSGDSPRPRGSGDNDKIYRGNAGDPDGRQYLARRLLTFRRLVLKTK